MAQLNNDRLNRLTIEIESYLETQLEKTILAGAIKAVEDTKNPLRLNNFSSNCREIITKVLHRLGPDEEVTQCSWFSPVEHTNGKPTRAQRIGYAIHGGLNPDVVETEYRVELSKTKKCIIDSYNELSAFTHMSEDNVEIDDAEDAFACEILSSIVNLFSQIQSIRSNLIDEIYEHIDAAVFERVVFETVGDLDLLATHYTVEGVQIEGMSSLQISSKVILVDVEGYVDVELQWGSNSDLRRGDGATQEMSLRFTTNSTLPIEDFGKATINEINVDTRDWFGE